MRRSIYILLGITLLVSCTPDNGCRKETAVTAGVVVERLYTDSLGITHSERNWDEVMVQGVGNDSVLYHNKSLKILRLPLRTDARQTDYAITWHDQTDTLHLQHSNDINYLSMACGCIIFHTIDSAWSSKNFIDSVAILNTTVENYEQDNVYVRVKSEK